MMNSVPTVSALSLLLVIVVTGCQDDRVSTYPVTGVVKFQDGSPVRQGTVELESIEHGTTATGSINEQGEFALGTYTSTDGAAAGEHHVIVMQMIVSEGLAQHQMNHGKPVDPKYGSYDSSPLKAQVEEKDTNFIEIILDH